ncbi:hypothetical protein PPL_08415 [Heterostelium album PN500]|uniref:Uncharacterized protein n=1 Tax=Heterostelium pallidum (strain ATCC 26659 / Pp 5 / PN500) TaxID=670386 RepID=D3BI47_HETP5|nr:hypothetical protein PPL_08415 [Heterostelium album PN500]EFA78947.1 hypothetical protein PPL_08415 [Heterostelium album PN500]|eukprot:XP_020431071.1 hypothetical protein PPL_08415 [Heterostelium album PN500]
MASRLTTQNKSNNSRSLAPSFNNYTQGVLNSIKSVSDPNTKPVKSNRYKDYSKLSERSGNKSKVLNLITTSVNVIASPKKHNKVTIDQQTHLMKDWLTKNTTGKWSSYYIDSATIFENKIVDWQSERYQLYPLFKESIEIKAHISCVEPFLFDGPLLNIYFASCQSLIFSYKFPILQ